MEELKQYVQFAHESSQTSEKSPSHPGDLQRLQSSIDALHGKLDHLAAREAAMVQLQGSVDLLHQRLDQVLGPV